MHSTLHISANYILALTNCYIFQTFFVNNFLINNDHWLKPFEYFLGSRPWYMSRSKLCESSLYFYSLFILTLNVFIDRNQFKNIHLISFRTFLPKFITFGCELFLEVYLPNIYKKKFWYAKIKCIELIYISNTHKIKKCEWIWTWWYVYV